MINTINSDLIRGNINTIILKALYEGDRYGYDIVKEIEQKSSGQYMLKQPTLYSCLKRLEVQGFIRSYWGAKSNGGRRKYYTLTDMGRDVFKKNKDEWEFSRTVIDKLISDKEYDLSKLDGANNQNADTDGILTVAAARTDGNEALEEGQTDYRQSIGSLFGGQLIGDDELYGNTEKNINDADTMPDEIDELINDGLFNNSEAVADDMSVSVVDINNALNTSQDAFYSSNETEKNFIDTTQILNELFNTQLDDNSYTEKLLNEKYTGSANVRAYSADTYFNDFSDNTSEPTYTADEDAEPSEILAEVNDFQSQQSAIEQEPRSDTVRNNAFLSYKTPLETKNNIQNEERQILDREYKNVLGRLLDGQSFMAAKELQTKTLEKTVAKTTDKNSPLTDEMRINIAKVESKTRRQDKDADTETDSNNQYAFIPSSKEDILNKNLNKMAEQTRQFTGDTVKNRVYDSRIDTIYRTHYHYYSNKLKLFQYAILFGIMLLETIFTFLLVRIGLGIHQPHDTYFYVLSILVAVAFPVAAAIMNFVDAERVKTGEFRLKELKENLFYKIWVMACCLILIYCVNIFLNMPVSFSKDYLATLLLPSLLTLCFPLSSVIFYFLYNSRRFNRT